MKYIFLLWIACLGCSKTQDIATKKITENAVAQNGQFQLSTPIIEFENIFFKEENKVQIKLNHEGTQIFYTLDGNEPTKKSKHYVEPISLKKNSKIRAKAFHENCLPSEVVEQQFLKIQEKNPIKNIEILTALSESYAGKGSSTLSDRKKGSNNFRDGNWLGFQNDTIEILLELESNFVCEKIIISLFEDNKSWIFIPKSIEVFTSKNGGYFQKEGGNIHPQTNSETSSGFYFSEIKIKNDRNYKFVKLLLHNIPAIPDWHPGKGSPAWVFLDEILIQ